MSDVIVEVVVLVAMVSGIFARSVIPVLRKLLETQSVDKPFKWDTRYTITLVLSFVSSVATAFTSFEVFAVPSGVSVVKLFVVAFVFGFGLNSGINEASKWVVKEAT
jgi:hypothetical protein